jgi:acyl carrier protein
MSRSESEIRDLVYGAIAATFQFPIADINAETTASDVEGWDSVSTSSLFFSIEDQLGVELPISELLDARNVGAMVAVVHQCVASSVG